MPILLDMAWTWTRLALEVDQPGRHQKRSPAPKRGLGRPKMKVSNAVIIDY
jgi:hypothetical protein